MFTTVTGVSGSGKSSLVSQALVELVAEQLGHHLAVEEDEGEELERTAVTTLGGRIASGMEGIKRLVRVDQKPIGRTPRSNLATYTGLFDHVRKLFAATKAARARHYDAGRFSFNVAKGRCETCEGEGFVMVELLFLPSVYAPCPTCHGARYNAKTLEIKYRDKNIADVLGMTVDAAWEFFADEPQVRRVPRRPAGGRPRLPAARPAGDRALRRRGPADQACDRAAADAARQHALRPRRADHRTASRRRREAHGAARWAGRMPAIPSSWWSTTCASWPGATGSSISARARATRAAVWWRPERLPRWLRTRKAAPRLTWRASKPREAVILPHALCRANHELVKPKQKWTVSSLPSVERRHDAILDPSAVAGIHHRYYKVDTQSIGFSGGSSLGIDSRGPKIALGSPGQNPYVSIL